MLNGLPVLIVEDEPFLALNLQSAVEDLDGLIIGPVATVADALALLKTCRVAAAIVDANLLDGNVTPLALELVGKSVPFVVHTAIGLPDDLAALHPEIPVVMKPASATSVIAVLLHRVSPDHGPFAG